ncbi:MAG: sulfite exporter TauE/SafE family protein [Clostridia bacterium]|nr:sulfite exporter TauE/SafE family protein [Clostridia bacterium]
MIKIERSTHTPLPVLLLCGVGAGFINGLLGAGGGVVLVFVLAAALGHEADGRDVYATALAVTLPVTLFSVWRYAGAGTLDVTGFARFLLPAVLGGAAGGWLLDRIDVRVTKRIFAGIVIVSGLSMLFRG